MNKLEHWKFCEKLSLVEAALLTLNLDPSEYAHNVLSKTPNQRPSGFDAIFNSLRDSVSANKIPGWIRKGAEFVSTQDEDERFWNPDAFTDYHNVTVEILDLIEWIKLKGIKGCFLLVNDTYETPPYLDPNHKHYSHKLAAAIAAWLEITNNPEMLKNKSPKQALETFLRKSAQKFALLKEDGSPNLFGIEEVAKVANWNTKGGATKTLQSKATED